MRATVLGNLCPQCRSLERHRLLWLFLQNRTDLFNGHEKTVLHIAPEPCFKGRIEYLENMHYIVSDLSASDPGKQIDITAINLQDQSVDVIICNHVLEHITEDVKAMRELARVLKNTGWAILNTPVDYPERLVKAGFKVSEVDYCSELGNDAVNRFVLLRDEMIYFCSK
jgi:SAM-dependent methyltransferase